MRIRTSTAVRGARLAAASGFAAALAPALFLLLPATLHADDVHLVNGNSFEGVIATVEGSMVKIRLPHGSLSLPLSRIERIDKGDSSLEEYLARKAALLASTATTADDWLELAHWADTHELPHGVRESALRAADLDPHLEGLEAILRGLGYLYQEDIDRWLPYGEAMHHRGFVYYDGAWITRETYAERVRAAEEARDRERETRAERAAQVALETAIEARIQAEVARELAGSQLHRGTVLATPVVVGAFYPGFVAVALPPQGPAEPPAPARDRLGNVLNPFAPPPGQVILEREFGGGLGTGLPNGWSGAPGRLHHDLNP